MNKIQKACSMIATCGWCGSLPFGGLLCSSLAIPLVFLFRFLNTLSPWLYWWTVALAVVVMIVSIHFSFRSQKSFYDRTIVLDKIFGLMLALIDMPLNIKIMIVGFCGFHLVRMFTPMFLRRTFSIDLIDMSNMLGVVVPSLLSGVVVNLALRLILWVAH